jgi:hypothetical protein
MKQFNQTKAGAKPYKLKRSKEFGAFEQHLRGAFINQIMEKNCEI